MKLSAGRSVIVLAIVLVGATMVAAFLVIGSPAEQRLLRLDERRVEDLNGVRAAVDTYYRTHERLPASLEEAGAPASMYKDPLSGSAYGYRVLGERSYELCAEFARAFTPEFPGEAIRNWPHPAGRHCFSIDVERVN